MTPGTHRVCRVVSNSMYCVFSAFYKDAKKGRGGGGRKSYTGGRVAAKGQTPATVLGGRLGVVLIFFFIILLFSNFSLMNRYYFHTQKNMCFVLRDEGMKDPLLPSCGLWILKPRPRVGKADFTHLPILQISKNVTHVCPQNVTVLGRNEPSARPYSTLGQGARVVSEIASQSRE